MLKFHENTLHCEGMCYSPERVLTEIFSLESAHCNARDGITLSKVGDDYYLREIARTISIISLQCRQQVFSYFLATKKELGIEKFKALNNTQRLKALEERYPTASVAIKLACGFEVCDRAGVVQVPFFLLVKKLCHVEKWSYPVIFNMDETGSAVDVNTPKNSAGLLIEVAKTDSVIGLDDTSKYIVNVEEFATASRILITECAECNLAPVAGFDIESDGAFD